MQSFIDKTGHIFSIQSFDSYPIGYEYEDLDYKLSIEECSERNKLSVNNYYIRPIRMLFSKEECEILELDITSSSQVFRLIGGKTIQNLLSESGKLVFEIDEDSEFIKNDLNKDDILFIEDEEYWCGIFYVIAYTREESEWSTNLLIHKKQEAIEQWSPLCIYGDFYDNREELIINANNMGIDVNKNILKSIYEFSYYNDVPDEALYDRKVKEYLLNYMLLKGEKGNINQAKAALEWFGWGKKLSLVKLIRNDNKIIAQYIRDIIESENDFLRRWDHFTSTGLLSVICKVNEENGLHTPQDWTKENGFIGEGRPLLDDLFKKMIYEVYDEEDIKFYKPYFDYTFTELGLKLSCLRAYYISEFLPIHSYVLSASLQYQVFVPDIKYHTRPFQKIQAAPIGTYQKTGTLRVEFPDIDNVFIYNQIAYVDSNLNVMSWYQSEGNNIQNLDVYYVNDAIARIPIKVISDITDTFNCTLILERNKVKCWESHFSFCQKNGERDWKEFIIFPRLMNERKTINYWDNKDYVIYLEVNNTWFTWKFHLQTPEMSVQLGKLEYKYDNNLQRQIKSITEDKVDFQVHMYLPSLIDVQNINFPRNVVDWTNDNALRKFVSQYKEYPSLPFSKNPDLAGRYWNQIHMYKLLDSDGNEILYNQNEPQVNLYRKFFLDNGNQKVNISKGRMNYDLYLMHDSTEYEDYDNILTQEEFRRLTPRWYIVIISRETIDNAGSEDELVAPEIVFNNGYKVSLIGSDKKWLINRMDYIDCSDRPVFKSNDIIVGTTSNIDMPFILDHGTKWEIVPFSLGMQKDAKVSSTTNTFIMSMGGDNFSNENGYYNITVRYSLDGEIQNQKKLELRFLVDDNK